MQRGFPLEETVDVTHMICKMDKEMNSKNSIFNRLEPAKRQHLKPLSIYSRMIICDQNESLHHQRKFSNPLINFKIEVKNNPAKKRKLDHTSPDDGYVSFHPKALSPDLGCFMDDCSPPARQVSVSPFERALKKTSTVGTEIKESVSRQLLSEHLERGSSAEPGADGGDAPHSFKREKAVLNLATAFDGDVEDILCLNPVGGNSAGGFSENVENCKGPRRNLFQNNPLSVPAVAHGQDGTVEEGRQELRKEMLLKVEDEGYFFSPDIKDVKTGKNPPQSPSPTSRGPQDESHPEGSSGHVSLSASDVEAGNLHLGSLEGDEEETWNIGPPLFESSVLHSITVQLYAGREQSRWVTEEEQGGVTEPVPNIQATLIGEKTTLDTSNDATLPLQVQVKSVVVALRQTSTSTTTSSSSKPVAPPLPEPKGQPTKPVPDEDRVSQGGKCLSGSRSQRPAVFDREEDWEREKRLYVHSVTRHMKENPGAGQDVVTELLNLMSHVADQKPGADGRQWQHPSDLTRRNYQRRFGNLKPKMALHEWLAKNCATHKRFANVPKIFQRSHLP